MSINFSSVAMILMGGIAAAAIAGAPAAVAATPAPAPLSCASAEGATVCQGLGNSQINAAPTTKATPQYPYLGGLGVYHHGH